MTTYSPYSPLKQAGQLYFIAGQVGIEGETKAVSPDITEQTHQALQNLKSVLTSAGLAMDAVVKVTVYLKRMDDFAAMNTAYTTYFNEPRPTRACVAVAELPRIGNGTELLIEIEAVAYQERGEGA